MYKPHPKLVIILVQVCPYMDVVGLMYDIVDTDAPGCFICKISV